MAPLAPRGRLKNPFGCLLLHEYSLSAYRFLCASSVPGFAARAENPHRMMYRRSSFCYYRHSIVSTTHWRCHDHLLPELLLIRRAWKRYCVHLYRVRVRFARRLQHATHRSPPWCGLRRDRSRRLEDRTMVIPPSGPPRVWLKRSSRNLSVAGCFTVDDLEAFTENRHLL